MMKQLHQRPQGCVGQTVKTDIKSAFNLIRYWLSLLHFILFYWDPNTKKLGQIGSMVM